MIDFQNAVFLKLHPVDNGTFAKMLEPLLLPNESIIGSYQTIRDGVVFTDKRIIAVNVQGVTGKKKDFTSLPYSKVQSFSVETAGMLDLDSELDIWFSGLGKVRFEFNRSTQISQICHLISEKVL